MYKEMFYRQLPPTVRNQIVVYHKCQYYRKIFKKGETVLVDLYHQLFGSDGKWHFVKAYENVPGIVKGTSGSKYIIELSQIFMLFWKQKGGPPATQTKFLSEARVHAKKIKSIHMNNEPADPEIIMELIAETEQMVLN
ncbi:MAG: hypothetical protein EA394_05295 [Bacteroidia bacterium]|nr:MAG: hypothetical protein EA394_05295 [Bacteroidia bacterium]